MTRLAPPCERPLLAVNCVETTVSEPSTDDHPWLPGQGKLEVKPLHSFEGEGTALVHWPPGERFVPHQHWGGEEAFVLSGTFQDEHGNYPQGTWLQSPHLSSHHPFVTEDTVIFVKTGHLPIK
jgi:anti-sigma factor ChrR (cupin superfamily)